MDTNQYLSVVKGLGKIFVHPFFKAFKLGIQICLRGDHNNRNKAEIWIRLKITNKFIPVETRHHNIAHNKIWLEPLRLFQPLLPVPRKMKIVDILQDIREYVEHSRIIFDEKNMMLLWIMLIKNSKIKFIKRFDTKIDPYVTLFYNINSVEFSLVHMSIAKRQ